VRALARALGVPVHTQGSGDVLAVEQAGTGPPLRAYPRILGGRVTEIRTFVPAPAGRRARTEPRLRPDGAGGLVPAAGLVNRGEGAVLAPVTAKWAASRRVVYDTAWQVGKARYVDLEVLAGGDLAGVYMDGTVAPLTPQEFGRWLDGLRKPGRSAGQHLRLLADAAPTGAAARAAFIWQVGELAKSERASIDWGKPREAGPAPGGEPVEIGIPGGFVSAGYRTLAGLRPWLQDRRRVGGVFDLVLEADADGLSLARTDGLGERLDAAGIGARLAGWRADGNADIRLLVPGGGRFEALMAALATYRGSDVLVTPRRARMQMIEVPGPGGARALDIVPVNQAGQPVDWQIIRPQNALAGVPPLLQPLPGKPGRLHTRTSVITGNNTILFPVRRSYASMRKSALMVPRHPTVVTIIARYRDKFGFMTQGPDSATVFLTGGELANQVAPLLENRPGSDVRLITHNGAAIEDWVKFRREAKAFAAQLGRVLWPAADLAHGGSVVRRDDLVVLDDKRKRVPWVPVAPEGVQAHSKNSRSGHLVPLAGPKVEAIGGGPASGPGGAAGWGLWSAGRAWQDRFGQVLAAAQPQEDLFVLGLDVGAEGLLSMHYGEGAYAPADPVELEQTLLRFGWVGQTLVIVTSLPPGAARAIYQCASWRTLGFRQCSFSHIARVPQRTAHTNWHGHWFPGMLLSPSPFGS
jgi:hypothetical protein